MFGFLEGSTAIARGQDDPIELRVGAELTLIKALKLTGSVTRGLTDGAADWGVSMVRRRMVCRAHMERSMGGR